MWGALVSLALAGALMSCGARTGVTAASDAATTCRALPFGESVVVGVAVAALPTRADIAFVIDTSDSEGEGPAALAHDLRMEIIPRVRARVSDARFAVAAYRDFPVLPFGGPDDKPFALKARFDESDEMAEAALGTLLTDAGGDDPEATVEGLYQTVSGAGLTGTYEGLVREWIAVPPSCPPGCFGAVCFRDDALRIVVLFADNRFHDGPRRSEPYLPLLAGSLPATYDDTIALLRERNVRVVGIFTGFDSARSADLAQVVRDTETFDAAGEPVLFAAARRIGELGIVVDEGVGAVVDALAPDVTAFAVDPDPGDDIDAAELVADIIPLTADPSSGVRAVDVAGRRFLGVRRETVLSFRVLLRNEHVVSLASPRPLRVEIVLRGETGLDLGRALIEFVVPASDGTCG